MPLFDAVGKGGASWLSLVELEQLGNNAFTQLPPSAQRWAEMLAAEVVSWGTFGPIERSYLSQQITGRFSQTELARVFAAVRFLALRNTAGGSFGHLGRQTGGLTQFQKQLIGGV